MVIAELSVSPDEAHQVLKTVRLDTSNPDEDIDNNAQPPCMFA